MIRCNGMPFPCAVFRILSRDREDYRCSEVNPEKNLLVYKQQSVHRTQVLHLRAAFI